jgi:hypothetical protein
MGRDLDLQADNDPSWTSVRLRVEAIRNDTLRVIAEAWAEDRSGTEILLDQLAAALPGPIEAWDAAAQDAEGDLQMDRPEIVLDETRALQLADELRGAAARTSTARMAAEVEPIPFPSQQDRRTAA